jgi:rod shape-determining protein MreC
MLDIRRRTGYLFLAVLVGQVVLISAQVNSPTGVPLIEAVAFGAFSEIQRVGSSVVDGVRGVWENYFALHRTRAENERLRQELAQLQVRLQEQRALAQRSASLQALLELKGEVTLPTVAANVISADPTPWFRTITIDKGSADGIRTDMAVLSSRGVVGRVVGVVAPRAARVQLLIDRAAAAGGLIERSREAGVVVGTGGDPPLEMDYVSNQADVTAGDAVVASGFDGIYPKGFPIGLVESTELTGSGSLRIRVRPAVDFASIEEVLVVTTPPATPERPDGAEGGE